VGTDTIREIPVKFPVLNKSGTYVTLRVNFGRNENKNAHQRKKQKRGFDFSFGCVLIFHVVEFCAANILQTQGIFRRTSRIVSFTS
jgi:hypothetical protein